MAQGYYEQLYKVVQKSLKTASKAKQKSTSDKINTLNKQISNKKTRLEAGGVDVNEATDKRNAVEKFLGLPEDQNVIFDIFELLGRPQQAIFGAIKANQEGEDAGKAAWEHFKGDEDTQFKDILVNAGMEDEKGKLNFVDVLGFTGDVLLDPADLIPVAGFSKFSKALEAGESVKNASKLLKSTSDLAFEGAGKLVKGGAKLADTNIEKVLKKMDETKGVTDNAKNIAKIGYTNPNSTSVAGLGKYLRNADEFGGSYIPKGNLEKYKEVKETISNAFKLKSGTKKAIKSANEADFLSNKTKDRISAVIKNYDDDVAKFSKKSGRSVEDINKAMTDVKEHLYLDRTRTGSDILKSARKGNLIANDENKKILDSLSEAVNKSGKMYGDKPFKLSYSVNNNGMIKLDNNNWSNKILDQVGVSLDPEALGKKYNLGDSYTDTQRKYLSALENDKEFMEFFEAHKDIDNTINKIIDEDFGTNLVEAYGDNKGYVPHIAVNKNKLGNFVEKQGAPILKGNTSILGERTRLGSVLEENNLYNSIIEKNYDTLNDAQKKFVDKNKDLFERSYSAALSKKYLDDMPELLKNNKVLTDTLLTQSLGNVDKIVDLNRSIKKASISGDKELVGRLTKELNELTENSNIRLLSENGKASMGFTSLQGYVETPKGRKSIGTLYAEKLEKLAEQLGTDDVSNLVKTIKKNSDKIAIDSTVLNMIDVLGDKKEVNALGRIYDKYLQFYKRNKVLSPTFGLNNITGNSTNMWLSGIDATTQAKLAPKAYRVVNEGPQLLYKRSIGGSLSKVDNEIADIYEILAKEGFGKKGSVASKIQDIPDSIAKYLKEGKKPSNMKEFILDGLPYLNAKQNEYLDGMSRAIIIMKGLDDPTYLSKLGVDNVGDAVRKVMFDPSELTEFEQKYMKRIIPFYTFAKKNLAYQIDNLGKNGNRYNKMMKAIESLQKSATEDNEENMAQYIKNNLYIPIPGLGEDGSYRVFRAQIPFGNLIDLAEDPLSGMVNMLGPVAKTPFELATGVNTFTGREIEKFSGEKSKNIPFMTKKGEYLLSNFSGLDVPFKNANRLYEGIAETMSSGGNTVEGLLQGGNNLLTMENNIETDKLNKLYEELDELENIMKQYKQQGYQFSTINELKKANRNVKAESIMATINKLNGLKENPYSIKK